MLNNWIIALALVGGTMKTCTAAETVFDPIANPKAVVTVGNARFTILKPAIIRMEWSPNAQFEDRASQVFIYRNQPVPRFATSIEGEWLKIRTDYLTLRYRKDGGRFDEKNLSVELTLNGRKIVWKPGTKDTGNLQGTFRTLDGISGATSLEPGLLSRNGWVVVDDSSRLVFTNTTPPWITKRANKDAVDWYFFGYGHDYKRALADFTKIAGRVPLPPRYVFGTWWSRYWAYSDEELKTLVKEFRDHRVPLDVLVVDMDWHLDGWTGYTWNPKYFPDPQGFLKWAHDEGLHTTLNLHPASGVGKHEAAFEDMAKALSIDPEKTERIPFDCSSPQFVDAYFKYLHHPMEQDGVDFWWIDWQQGTGSKIEGLDPLWWLNYLHWRDMEQRSEANGKRPLIFSRWGGLGNHRYQIGFSGDTFCNWSSLAFQPFFTATAGNVGFGYWSHDIGGHQPGPVDPELYARWIQYGVFSPILRTHTTKNPEAERRIWAFPKEVFRAAASAFRLRSKLLPYIYSAARQCYDTGLPLCRPLYYEWPELPEAYKHTGEYLFGDQFLVAPITEPLDPIAKCAQTRIWIPPGQWTNWYSGTTYEGPTYARLLVPLGEIPFFVREGGIIPTKPSGQLAGKKPDDKLILHFFPGESDEMRLYEDDGISDAYKKGHFSSTPVSSETVGDTRVLAIGPTTGSYAGMPSARAYELRVRDVWPPESVTVRQSEDDISQTPASWHYEPFSQTVLITIPSCPIGKRIEVVVKQHSEDNDTSTLRNGLRGQVLTLGAVRKDITQEDRFVKIASLITQYVQNTMKILGNAEESYAARVAAARDYKDSWLPLVMELAKSRLSRETRLRGFIRLLGIYRKVRVLPDPKEDGRFVAEIEVATSLRIPKLQALAGKVTLTINKPWNIEGEGSWTFKKLSDTNPFVVRVPLSCDDHPTTGTLSIDVSFQLGKATIHLPTEKVFLPSIGAWKIIGPFDCPFATGLTTVFPPEKEIDLDAEYKGQGDKPIRWQTVKRPIAPDDDMTDEFFIDFDDVYGGRKYNAVSYAMCYLNAMQETEAVLALGTDDAVLVWLNGKEIHRKTKGRPYTSKEDRVPVKLHKGSNTLLLKITQGGGDWGFCVHVETPDGHPATNISTSLTPSGPGTE